MKKLLPFLLVLLVAFAGCGDDDVSPLVEAKAMLRGKWRSVSRKLYDYIPDVSYKVQSSTFRFPNMGLIFSRDSVTINDYGGYDDIVINSTTEELQLSERAGKRYLMLQTEEFEVLSLSRDSLQLMRRIDLNPRTIREITFTYSRGSQ